MAMDLAIREADGVKIRFAEAGQGGSETVVLTSPWPESVLAFRKVWDRMAERFHLLAIDLPGFGQSERQLDLLSPYSMGAFLLQLVKEWDLGRCISSPLMLARPLPFGRLRMILRSCAAWRSAAVR